MISQQPPPPCPPFSFKAIAEDDITKVINSISTKAVGTDGINIQMLQLLSLELCPAISHIINHSLENGCFPTLWKSANVIPLPKVSNPSSVSQLRPISILPVLSKILQNVVHKQLSMFLNHNNLLCPYQSGFRPGHSTVGALTKISDDIRLAINKQQLTALVLLDFSSAFNSIDHDILIAVLSSLNVSFSAIAWFRSYLSGRSQRVRLDDSYSDFCNISAGVPQGGVLSPLLFSIFINSATKFISSSYHLYADDLQIYHHFNVDELSAGIVRINSDLCNIDSWAKAYGLLINPSKSQAMICGSPYMLRSIALPLSPAITLGGNIIPLSVKVKNLGVIF